MVKSQPGVPRVAVSHIMPERIDPLVGMPFAECVGPSLLDEARVRRTTHRLDQSIVIPRGGWIDIDICRGDIVIASQHDRNIFAQRACGRGRRAA
jgi:hypothetical protein